MAHPFRYFRKHQKAFLAVAAVVAMFVFVIGDQITAYMGQGGGGRDPNEVVATWKSGKLSLMELENLTQRRYLISKFLDNIRMLGAQRMMEAGLIPNDGTFRKPPVPDFVIQDGTTGPAVQLNVVTTRILADQAKKAGITISDEVINYFLKETSFRRVSDQEIITILQGVRGGDARGLEDQLFAGLRELLLGNAYLASFDSNIYSVLPEQRWEDWQRINNRISLEVATIPTRDFVKDVPNPTDAELATFYEQFKNAEPHIPHSVMGAILPSADPGFKVPRKVRLNYLLGDVNAWTEKYRESITDAEIADYYERNKRTQFVKTAGSTAEFDEELFKAEEADTPADEPATETPATETPATETPATETPAAGTPAAGTPATDETPATTPATEDAVPAGEAEPATTPAADESGGATRDQKFQLVAFQAEPATDAEGNDAEGADSETPAVEEAAGEDAAAPAEEPAAPADETPAEETAEIVEEATETVDTSADATAPADSATDDADDKTEYEALEDVKDAIRDKLARDKAVVELTATMDRVEGQLQSEYSPYSIDVITARSDEQEIPKPPASLTDLKQRATDSGLTSEETVLLSQRELADTFVGKAIDSQSQSRLVLQAAFTDLQLYEPFLAKDLDGNLYLVTKVEDVPEKVPTLDDIKNEVVEAWKQREAAKLALKKAEELAKEAEKSGDRLSTFFIGKGYEPITSDLFSWYTFGTTPADMQRGPKLGEAPPLEAVGPDFMEKAFSLKDNEVAALLNYSENDAFVFRLDRRESTPEELRQLFLNEANNWYGGQVMMQIRMMNQREQVLAEVIERSGLDQEKLEAFFESMAAPSDE